MFNIKRNNGTNGSDRGDEKPRKWEFLRLLRGRLIRCLVCDDKDVVDASPSKPADKAAPEAPGALQAMARLPTVDIVEQPACTAPFRSLGCVGWITGVHSTAENKTYPSIRINNYEGNVVIGVYCSNKNDPFSPHPNKLANSMDPPKQVVTVKTSVSASANECHFSELGIQRGDRFDIQKEVGQRKKALMYIARSAFGACNSTDVNNTLSIDTAGYNAAGNNAIVVVNLPTMLNPLSRISWFRDEKYFDFKKEFVLADDYEHHTDPQRIDMNTVRLVFQVYLQEERSSDAPWVPLAPVATDLIYDDYSLPRKRDVLTEYDLFYE